MDMHTLDDGLWRLDVIPAWGGRLARLRVAGFDLLQPIQDCDFDPLAWPRGGAYPLIPYSNRLQDARLAFSGKVHELPAHPAARPHSLHGVAHTLAWQVEHQDATSLTLVCHYQGEHWPWPFVARQRFRLQDGRLITELELTNRGDTAMPAGLGLHPYFARQPGMRVSLSPGREWLLDGDYLPTGATHTLQEPLVLEADAQGAERAHYLSEWPGELRVDYPIGRLRLEADRLLSHFIVFAPAGAPFLCLEPVSHLADAFNRDPAQWSEVGTQVLEAGASLRTRLAWHWQAT